METILIYLAKSSAILGIFYIIYVLFLNNETFFEMNRFYLISGIFAAFTIPFITITKTVYIEPVTTTIPSEMLAAEFLSGVTATPVEPEFTINWIYVFGVLYVLGMAIMFAKLIGQLVSVYRIISNNEISEENGIKFVKTNKDHTPFSFFSYVVYNPELFSKEELDIILTHEKAHSKERHSVDILISKMTNILQWLNPFAWLYQRSITQNLEYLADKKATNDLDCRKTYQLTLLKATKLNHLSITNNFFNSLIKKRIIMLQQQKSKKRNMFKLAIVVPVLIAFVYVFNTEVRAQVKQTVSNVSATLPAVDEELRKDKVIKIKIDKNTSKVDLEKMKKSLKKEGIDFKYRKLKFNKSNELTSISVSVKDKNGNSESYAMSSDKGIDPFYFHTSGDDMSFYGGGSYDKGDYVFVTKDGASIHEIKMREHKEKMRKHKEKMKAHKIKIKAHTDLGGDHEDVWVSEDGKTIKINKSKVIVIGDGDGEHEEHEIIIDGDRHKDGVIIINGKKMDLGEMDSDFDFDLEDMFDGKEMIIDLDFDDKTKKMLINGEEIDMEDMEKWKEKAEKMKKEWKEKSKLMMLKSNEMKDKMRKMEKKMKIKMEKDFVFQGKDEDGKLQTYSFRIDSDNDDENVFFLNGKGHNDFPMKKEFNFRDDPEIDRLIVIDGKTSDFMTLKKLEKEEKIESVDILKSSTAKSIYGAKAKDGAIIVITKNN